MVSTLDEDKHDLYTDMVLKHLSRTAQEAFEGMLNIKNYEPQSEQFKRTYAAAKARAEAEGRAEGMADGELSALRNTLKKQIRLKFQSLSKEHEVWIDAAGLEALDQALERILSAESPEGVIPT